MRCYCESQELIDKYDLVEMLKNEYFEPLLRHIWRKSRIMSSH